MLTRGDYARYEKGKLSALAGIVQAQLMTSHMLFVGFSMGDANYQRILRSVVEALGLGGAELCLINAHLPAGHSHAALRCPAAATRRADTARRTGPPLTSRR